jgi:hypothetical protein
MITKDFYKNSIYVGLLSHLHEYRLQSILLKGLIKRNILSFVKIFCDYSPFSLVMSVNEMFRLEPSPRSIEENYQKMFRTVSRFSRVQFILRINCIVENPKYIEFFITSFFFFQFLWNICLVTIVISL